MLDDGSDFFLKKGVANGEEISSVQLFLLLTGYRWHIGLNSFSFAEVGKHMFNRHFRKVADVDWPHLLQPEELFLAAKNLFYPFLIHKMGWGTIQLSTI